MSRPPMCDGCLWQRCQKPRKAYAMRRHLIFRGGITQGIIAMMLLAFVGISLHSSAKANAAALNLTQYVNPFIGTQACPTCSYGSSFDTRDVFPGADYPMGMVG